MLKELLGGQESLSVIMILMVMTMIMTTTVMKETRKNFWETVMSLCRD